MARGIHKLTALAVGRAKVSGYYGDGGGLYLRVGPTGAKSWVFRFAQNGRTREMGLGPFHTIPLAEARRKAQECRKLRLEGIDPIQHRRAARGQAQLAAAKAMSFEECAEAYIQAHQAGWRTARSERQWRGSLRDYVYPAAGKLPVAAVDLRVVLSVVEPIWPTIPETASRIRGRIEGILDWATTRGYRSGENPARWRGHLENLLPTRRKVKQIEHHTALPYAEVSEFMAKLRARQTSVVARAFELMILTAARTGEILGARWNEIDMAERVWTIPAVRMKAHREHRGPLSDAAMAILGRMTERRVSDFVFPGRDPGRPLGQGAVLEYLRAPLHRPDLTAHGFRSTFRDWAAERTSYPAEVAEMALAHSVGNAVEQAYRRSDLFDRRRRLMQEWATFCATPTASSEVVAIRA